MIVLLADGIAVDSLTNDLEVVTSSGFLQRFMKARRGTKEQQAELLNSFRGYLRVIAINTIGLKTGANLSVSDLVQSAIIDGCADFDGCRAACEEEFKAWLRQILLNDIVARYRYLRRKKRDTSKEVPFESGHAVISPADWPVAVAQRKEEQEQLIDAIEQLSTEHRLVILLRHQEKLTFGEVGLRLNRSADAARMLFNRAIDELARILRNSSVSQLTYQS